MKAQRLEVETQKREYNTSTSAEPLKYIGWRYSLNIRGNRMKYRIKSLYDNKMAKLKKKFYKTDMTTLYKLILFKHKLHNVVVI